MIVVVTSFDGAMLGYYRLQEEQESFKVWLDL